MPPLWIIELGLALSRIPQLDLTHEGGANLPQRRQCIVPLSTRQSSLLCVAHWADEATCQEPKRTLNLHGWVSSLLQVRSSLFEPRNLALYQVIFSQDIRNTPRITSSVAATLRRLSVSTSLRSKLERGRIKSEEAFTNGEMIETRSMLSAV